MRLVVTGCVTEAHQYALHPVIIRAQTLIPPTAVTVDLTGAEHVEAGAVELLRRVLEHHGNPQAGPVDVLAPARARTHPPVPTGIAPLETVGWCAA